MQIQKVSTNSQVIPLHTYC